jgi:hypothetical protein
MVLATLDPAIPEDGVVLRMDRLHEADDVVFPFVLLELFGSAIDLDIVLSP